MLIQIGNIQISYKTKDSKYILVSIDISKIMDISECSNKISSEVDSISDVNKKLEQVLQDITTQFKA